MVENQILIVDKPGLNRLPELKEKLNSLAQQLVEQEETYTYLAHPDYELIFRKLLIEHNVGYVIADLAPKG